MAGKSVPKVKQKLDKKDLTLSLAFLLPAILITVIFVIYPVFDTVGLSFRKWNGMFGAAKQWVGLENYQKIFSDKLSFGQSQEPELIRLGDVFSKKAIIVKKNIKTDTVLLISR